MPGKIKEGFGTLIGNAGEYYVVAELLTRNVIAALAPRNAPAFDVLATKGMKTVRIRVKTRTADHDEWQWNAKADGEVFRFLSKRDDFVALVHFTPERRDALGFWIVPTHVLDRWLKADFKTWVKAPGKNGRPHDPANTRRMLPYRQYRERLEPYEDAWESLWSKPGAR